MTHLRPMGLKKKKKKSLDYKKVLPFAMAALMVSSLFVLFTFPATVEKASLRIVRVDPVLGNSEDLYNGEVELQGNITALQLVRGAGFSVQFENGTFTCVRSFCNNEQNWEFYVNGFVPMEEADEFIVNNGDQVFLVFR